MEILLRTRRTIVELVLFVICFEKGPHVYDDGLRFWYGEDSLASLILQPPPHTSAGTAGVFVQY